MQLRKAKLNKNDKSARNAQKNLDFSLKTLFNMINGWRKMQYLKVTKCTNKNLVNITH